MVCPTQSAKKKWACQKRLERCRGGEWAQITTERKGTKGAVKMDVGLHFVLCTTSRQEKWHPSGLLGQLREVRCKGHGWHWVMGKQMACASLHMHARVIREDGVKLLCHPNHLITSPVVCSHDKVSRSGVASLWVYGIYCNGAVMVAGTARCCWSAMLIVVALKVERNTPGMEWIESGRSLESSLSTGHEWMEEQVHLRSVTMPLAGLQHLVVPGCRFALGRWWMLLFCASSLARPGTDMQQ